MRRRWARLSRRGRSGRPPVRRNVRSVVLRLARVQARRDNGATVFLDLETLERHEDQWAYLSALGRMTPAELKRADRAGKVAVAAEVSRLNSASSTKTRPPAPPVLRVRLDAGIPAAC
jgi:hypothetical protein